MPETTPLIKAALNLRAGAGFDVYKEKGTALCRKQYAPSGCESDILPFRHSAILTERFCIHRPFTRAIRKLASSMFSAAAQLLLLIERRSLHGIQQSDFRASTNLHVWSHG